MTGRMEKIFKFCNSLHGGVGESVYECHMLFSLHEIVHLKEILEVQFVVTSDLDNNSKYVEKYVDLKTDT